MTTSHAYYSGDAPGLPAGSYHYGVGGLGVLGSEIPSSGEHGPGYMYPSLSLPGDAGKEYYGVLGAIPAGLTISVDEYSRVTASANDGSYVVPFALYENGQLLGSSSFTLNFGPGSGAAVVNLSAAACLQVNASTTASITVTPAQPGPKVVTLIGLSCVQANTSGSGAVGVLQAGAQIIDASKLATRTVVFQGGIRTVRF